jgi:hypothetical protein
MWVYVVRKWPLRGRSRFVCWNITRVSLWLLFTEFTETGCLCKQKSSGHPFTAEDDIERVRASFLHSPKTSTETAAKEISMSKTTVWRVLSKRLVFKPYRIQMVQQFLVINVCKSRRTLWNALYLLKQSDTLIWKDICLLILKGSWSSRGTIIP